MQRWRKSLHSLPLYSLRFLVFSLSVHTHPLTLLSIFYRGKLCQQYQSPSLWWRASLLVRPSAPAPTPVPSPLAGPCWWTPCSGLHPHHERQRPCSACCDSCRSPRACTLGGTGRVAGPEEAAAVCQEQKTGQLGQHAATESSLLPQPQQPHPPGLYQPRGMEVSFTICNGFCQDRPISKLF